MRKIIVVFILLIFNFALASEVYCEKNKFGLEENDEKITKAKYTKLIRLGQDSYLFMYKSKYGIMASDGTILVEPKYTKAERFIGRYAKLGKGSKYALFTDKGEMLIEPKYNSIDLLFGKMFLVGKNYKYGIIDFDGDILLAPVADDIYMPDAKTIKLLYGGNWYDIERVSKDSMELPENMLLDEKISQFKIIKIVEQPITTTGYGLVSASDYFMKIFSSISPAYERTIDELILSHGADTAVILLNPVWMIKFPFVYARNYADNFKTPNNGPLADVKANLKNKLN